MEAKAHLRAGTLVNGTITKTETQTNAQKGIAYKSTEFMSRQPPGFPNPTGHTSPSRTGCWRMNERGGTAF